MSIDTYEKCIWKFPLNSTTLSVPVGAKCILTAMQEGTLCAWFEFHKPKHNDLAFRDIEVEVHETGHTIPEGREHIGSVIDGVFVWHVYKLQEHL